ncbi:MAG: nickel-dependent hydrogenase large subunit [Candidatus Thorarchaeota archaeon]
MTVRLSHSLTRVLGTSELSIRYKTKEQIDVKYRMLNPRDFLSILRGQHITDLPKLVSRICGTCSVSHRIAAVKAIEMAVDIKAPPLARTLRELSILGEILRSHTYSVFFSSFPDLLGLAETISRQDVLGGSNVQQRLRSQGFSLLQHTNEMVETISGCQTLAPAIVPGGFLRNITSEESKRLQQSLQLGLSGIRWAKELYRSLLSEVSDDVVSFDLDSPAYVSCFDTEKNRFSGARKIAIILSHGDSYTFSASDFSDILGIKHKSESPTNSVYTLKEKPDSLLLTGPHARLAALDNQSDTRHRGISNMFYAGLLRLDEMEFCTLRAHSLLENEWMPEGELMVPWDSREGVGGGCVESARGSLLYRLEIDAHSLVKEIDICTPTELNAEAITQLLMKVTEKCNQLGWSMDRITSYAKMAIRSFDPCVFCATHSKVDHRSSKTQS